MAVLSCACLPACRIGVQGREGGCDAKEDGIFAEPQRGGEAVNASRKKHLLMVVNSLLDGGGVIVYSVAGAAIHTARHVADVAGVAIESERQPISGQHVPSHDRRPGSLAVDPHHWAGGGLAIYD